MWPSMRFADSWGDAADSGHDLDVYLCVFDKTAFEISSSIDKRLRAYI